MGQTSVEERRHQSSTSDDGSYAGCDASPSIGGGAFHVDAGVGAQAYDNPNCFHGPRPPAWLSAVMGPPPKNDLDVAKKTRPFVGPFAVAGGAVVAGVALKGYRASKAAQMAEVTSVVQLVRVQHAKLQNAFGQLQHVDTEIGLALSRFLAPLTETLIEMTGGTLVSPANLRSLFDELNSAIRLWEKQRPGAASALQRIRTEARRFERSLLELMHLNQ